jgi:hypothetical protein
VRCVARFAPFGLFGTIAHLDRLVSDVQESDRIVAALDVLDAARATWREELARFAALRKAAKARGLRRVVQLDLNRYATFGWPGDATGQADGRALDHAFLHRYGMALWEPAPVDLRRRLRRVERALQPPPRFGGCLLAAMIVVEGLIALLAWLIFDPPRIFWYNFVPTAVGAVVYAVFDGQRRAPRHRSSAAALSQQREALLERLQ